MDIAPDVVTVLVTRADGGLTVSRIIENEYREPSAKEKEQGVTEKVLVWHVDVTPEYVESLIRKREEAGSYVAVSWRFAPNDYIDENTDQTYRNAWKDEPGLTKPNVDLPKAKEIQRIYLRLSRLAEFCRLDNDYRIADEAGDVAEKTRLGAERQKFRDVTADPRIEAATTVEELKTLTLPVLVPETQGVRYMDKMKVSPFIESVQRAHEEQAENEIK